MSVSLVSTGLVTNSTATVSSPQSFTVNIGTLTNGGLAVGCGINDGGGAVSGVSVTWNSVSMLQVSGSDNNGSGFDYSMFGLINPANGSNTLTVTWTGGPNTLSIGFWSFSGVDQGATSTSFIHGNNVQGTPINTDSLTITTASGNATVVGWGNGSALTSSTPSSGSADFSDETQLSTTGVGVWGFHQLSTGTSDSYTINITSADFIIGTGCSVKALNTGFVADNYHRRYTHRKLRPANTNRDPMERRRRVVGWRQAPSGLIVPERKLLIPERLKRAA